VQHNRMNIIDLIEDLYVIEHPQMLLLQALILEEPRARESVDRWLTTADFETMEFHTLGLIPALLRKYGDTLGNSPHRARLQGIQRYYFFRNSLILAAGKRVLARLISEGIDVLLFKGVAVSLKYHRNIYLRPMGDIDVLVRREDVRRAEEILLECGYSYLYPGRDRSTDIHSHDYVNSRFCGFDLHWYALLESPHPGIDDGLWQRAELFDWDGLVVKLMSPEDLILTSAVNGVRDAPIRPQWIYDLVCIVEAEPALSWDTVWGEAGARQIRAKVFVALNLVRKMTDKIIPEELIQSLLNSDPGLYRDFLQLITTEGRTLRLTAMEQTRIDGFIHADTPQDPLEEYPSGIDDSLHIRYYNNENGGIDRLFLRWIHLQRIPELFLINDLELLHTLITGGMKGDGGYLDLPAGLLSLKGNVALPGYSARLSFSGKAEKLFLAPGEVREIGVEIENDSPHCWPMCASSKVYFGLSYHLLSGDGALLVWDLPRTYFSRMRSGEVAFIEPHQKIPCKLTIHAPTEPGCYIAQLDLVHEFVTWFSSNGNEFPRLDFEVWMYKTDKTYTVNGSMGIVHETIGCETIIINTYNGEYYSATDYASVIWNAVVGGYSGDDIVSAFASAGIFNPEQRIVQQFISKLLIEQLITPVDGCAVTRHDNLVLNETSATGLPVLVKHADPRYLTLVHPVRNASLTTGWPHRNDTTVG